MRTPARRGAARPRYSRWRSGARRRLRAAAAAGPLHESPGARRPRGPRLRAPAAAEAEEEDEEPPAPPDLRRKAPDALETLGHMGYEPAAAKRALAAAKGDFSKAVRALERECRRASGADPILDAATGGRASAAVPPSLADDQCCDVRGAGNCKRRCGRCRGAYCAEGGQRSVRPRTRRLRGAGREPRDADERVDKLPT